MYQLHIIINHDMLCVCVCMNVKKWNIKCKYKKDKHPPNKQKKQTNKNKTKAHYSGAHCTPSRRTPGPANTAMILFLYLDGLSQKGEYTRSALTTVMLLLYYVHFINNHFYSQQNLLAQFNVWIVSYQNIVIHKILIYIYVNNSVPF